MREKGKHCKSVRKKEMKYDELTKSTEQFDARVELHVVSEKDRPDRMIEKALEETRRSETFRQFRQQREREMKRMYRRMSMECILTSSFTYLIVIAQIVLVVLSWHIAHRAVSVNEFGEAVRYFNWPLFVGVVVFSVVSDVVACGLRLREFWRVRKW